MKHQASGRIFRVAGACVAACGFGGIVPAQVIPSNLQWIEPGATANWISAGGGAVWVDGDTASYQRRHQTDRRGFGGIEEFSFSQEVGKDTTFTVKGKSVLGSGEHRIGMRLQNSATGLYLDAGFRESRVFYDGSGGYFPSTGAWFETDDNLHVDRGEYWVEGGLEREAWTLSLRYARLYREGTKDSTIWGDSTQNGATRGIAPSFYDLDEQRDILTADLEYHTTTTTAGAGLRYEQIEIDNARQMRRRPDEPAADRFLTQRDGSDSDLFSAHGFVESHPSENLTLAGAASHTSIDTNLTGSRIFGATLDPVYDPNFSRRQARDEGFLDLVGDSNWNQYVLNGNFLYMPAKSWRIDGGLRYEHQTQDVVSEFGETAVGTTAARITALDELEGVSDRNYHEWLEDVEVSYHGVTNWVFSASAESAQGNGELQEELLEVEDGAVDLSRDTGFDRTSAKVALGARWYPTSGLNFAAGAYRKVQRNSYDTVQDSTPPTGADRYPAFITWQRFTTDDFYGRGTWRASSLVAFTGRYDYQRTVIDSEEEGLDRGKAAEMKTHILAGTVTVTPMSNLVLQGTMNYVFDTIVSGGAVSGPVLAHVTGKFDNNYHTATLLAVYAVDEKTDLQADFSLYRSNNFQDFSGFTPVSAVTVPYGMSARDHTVAVMITRRVTADLQWSLRYAYGSYREVTSGGHNDFDANIVYGRVQLRF